eukprot:symbB.v1.2.005525.t1/scaffold323.1/size229223/2
MAAMDGDDLAKLNDELRKQGPSSSSGPWLALESNPEIFTNFGQKIGLPQGWEFCDVLGLDPELLEMVPGTTVACILLFPCSDLIYTARGVQDAQVRNGKSHKGASAATETDLFFLKQVIGFGNACGTIACLHAISNCRAWLSLDGPLETFVTAQASSSPELRGQALLEDTTLRASSESAAASEVAQTALPARDGPPLDHHFAAFVRSRQNRIIELDGTKRCPIDHGETSEGRFLEDVAVAVRRHFLDVDPDSVDFSFLALSKVVEPSPRLKQLGTRSEAVPAVSRAPAATKTQTSY